MIRVIHLGMGDIGKATILGMLKQPQHLKLVGAVDVNPTIAGKTLREVMNDRSLPPIRIVPTIADVLRSGPKPDVATMTTGSRTEQVQSTLEDLIDAGIHVVSTCEELSFANLRAPRIAAVLDKRAKKKSVAILGTGVNPGFAMDAFALTCTAPCTTVRSIRVVRSLDASKRRYQLQKKVGAGMSVAEVKKLIRQNAIGHVGLGESCAMIAAGLGWKLNDIREKFEPVVADHLVTSDFYRIEPGQVRGMRMTAAGIVRGKKLIDLDLTMAFDADTFDEVIVDGTPHILVRTKSGFPGEASTVGLTVNCARVLHTLPPGLRTMLDVLKVRSVGV